MKKILSFLLASLFICCTILCSTVYVSAIETEQGFYTTSDEIDFKISDFDIYIEDFAGTDFKTSQEVVDHIYAVGFRRTITRDTKQTIFGKELTEDEIELLIQYPIYGANAYVCSEKAKSTTQALYLDNHSDGELGNAFQHAYWVILMYYDTSPSFAIEFAVAHENYENNPELHKTMDLFNDYAAYNCCNLRTFDNAPTDEELKNFALELTQYGYLQYIIFDYEYIARSVYYMATKETKIYMGHADLYAYTDSNVPYDIPETVYEVVPLTPDGPVLRP